MTEKQFKLWQINQTILHLGDIAERCKDEEYKRATLNEISRLEDEKQRLIKEGSQCIK